VPSQRSALQSVERLTVRSAFPDGGRAVRRAGGPGEGNRSSRRWAAGSGSGPRIEQLPFQAPQLSPLPHRAHGADARRRGR
jgi:hypothetical protein